MRYMRLHCGSLNLAVHGLQVHLLLPKVDSTCFNCMCSVAEPPLLRRQGRTAMQLVLLRHGVLLRRTAELCPLSRRRPSDVLLMQRSASARIVALS